VITAADKVAAAEKLAAAAAEAARLDEIDKLKKQGDSLMADGQFVDAAATYGTALGLDKDSVHPDHSRIQDLKAEAERKAKAQGYAADTKAKAKGLKVKGDAQGEHDDAVEEAIAVRPQAVCRCL